jgi:hypothetical protein
MARPSEDNAQTRFKMVKDTLDEYATFLGTCTTRQPKQYFRHPGIDFF